MIDLTKLRQDAMAATQGRWKTRKEWHGGGKEVYPDRRVDVGVPSEICTVSDIYNECAANATHIANLSPSTAIALIEAVQKAKAVAYSNGFDAALPDKLDALREALRPFTKE